MYSLLLVAALAPGQPGTPSQTMVGRPSAWPDDRHYGYGWGGCYGSSWGIPWYYGPVAGYGPMMNPYGYGSYGMPSVGGGSVFGPNAVYGPMLPPGVPVLPGLFWGPLVPLQPQPGTTPTEAKKDGRYASPPTSAVINPYSYGFNGVYWGPPVFYYIPTFGAAPGNDPNQPVVPPMTPPPVLPDPKPLSKGIANIKLQLPAEAKLFVEGRLTTTTGADRTFVTPPLGTGKFVYEVKAELMVKGQVVVEKKRLVVEAGETVVESFPKLFAAVETGTGSIAGK